VRLFSTPENTVLTLRNAKIFAAEGKEVDVSWTRESWWAVIGAVVLPVWLAAILTVRYT